MKTTIPESCPAAKRFSVGWAATIQNLKREGQIKVESKVKAKVCVTRLGQLKQPPIYLSCSLLKVCRQVLFAVSHTIATKVTTSR